MVNAPVVFPVVDVIKLSALAISAPGRLEISPTGERLSEMKADVLALLLLLRSYGSNLAGNIKLEEP